MKSVRIFFNLTGISFILYFITLGLSLGASYETYDTFILIARVLERIGTMFLIISLIACYDWYINRKILLHYRIVYEYFDCNDNLIFIDTVSSLRSNEKTNLCRADRDWKKALCIDKVFCYNPEVRKVACNGKIKIKSIEYLGKIYN